MVKRGHTPYDAAYAFNSINHPAALWNCRVLWPSCSQLLVNSYCGFAVIILRGMITNRFHALLHCEGTTQGCPLAMLMYAIGIQPLVLRLKNLEQHKQNW